MVDRTVNQGNTVTVLNLGVLVKSVEVESPAQTSQIRIVRFVETRQEIPNHLLVSVTHTSDFVLKHFISTFIVRCFIQRPTSSNNAL